MMTNKRTSKYDVWYETTYWRNGWSHTYITKTYTEHHDFLHARAEAEGLQAITTQWNRTTINEVGTYGEEIKATNRGKLVKHK